MSFHSKKKAAPILSERPIPFRRGSAYGTATHALTTAASGIRAKTIGKMAFMAAKTLLSLAASMHDSADRFPSPERHFR
jgi:hypothetical protein